MQGAMNEGRQSGRLDPGSVWTVITDAPLKGMSLAREACRLLAWDDGDQVYLIDSHGKTLSNTRMPGKIIGGALSDDGRLVALLGLGSKLWLLGPDLDFIEDRAAITDATALAIDPHGRYVAVASKMNLVQIYNQYGKLAGRFETRQPLAGLSFVPDRLAMVGIGTFSMLMGFELSVEGDGGKLGGELVWTQNLLSSVGRMAVTGDGSAILVSCYSHGVQRFDGEGRTEGTYHLSGSPTHAVPDFAGRTIAVGTLEGELSILSGSGNVRWQGKMNGPPVALEMDPLGRYVIQGIGTGEITKVDLYGGGGFGAKASGLPAQAGTSTGVVRNPDWLSEVVKLEDQAEYTVLAVLDDPPRVGVIGPANQLELFTQSGKRLGQAPDIQGVGRIIRTAPGWIAAATDRMIVLCDCKKNTGQKLDLSLVELTHLALRPDDFGLAIVQERDRIGRLTMSGRWVWKKELRQPVEELAVGAEGHMAVTLEDGSLMIHDGAGTQVSPSTPLANEALCLVAAPKRSPEGIAWVTLARRAQILRGHALGGRTLWESPVPFESWQLHLAGRTVVVSSPDGRSIAYDGAGHALAQSRAEGSLDLYIPGIGELPLRIARQGVHLLCSELDGQVLWRSIGSQAFGSIAVSRTGVAVMIGKNLAFFSMKSESR